MNRSLIGLIVSLAAFAALGADALKDGIYAGKAGGYKGPLRVAVTVKDGEVADVEVTSHKESRKARKALSEMPRRIIRANSVDVDAISGATMTANAIKAAVRDALRQAR